MKFWFQRGAKQAVKKISADPSRALKVGMGATLAYGKSLPGNLFGMRTGLFTTGTVIQGSSLVKDIKHESERIGLFDLHELCHDPVNDLVRGLHTDLRQATRYKSILLELDRSTYETAKYALPSVILKDAQIVLVVHGMHKAESEKLYEIQIRKEIYKIVRLFNSIGNYMKPTLVYTQGEVGPGEMVIAFSSGSSKKECYRDFLKCGYIGASSDWNIVKAFPFDMNQNRDIDHVQNLNMIKHAEMERPSLQDIFGTGHISSIHGPLWLGQLFEENLVEDLVTVLQNDCPEDDWTDLEHIARNTPSLNDPDAFIKDVTPKSQKLHSIFDKEYLKPL